MYCEVCGRTAATRQVTFHQNIGLLVIRFPSKLEGNLCKSCIHGAFWRMTLTSMVLGWWGIISFVTNLFFVLNNIIAYLGCLTMPAAGDDLEVLKRPATSTAPDYAIDRLERCRDQIGSLLAEGYSVEEVGRRASDMANVPLKEAISFVDAVRVQRRL